MPVHVIACCHSMVCVCVNWTLGIQNKRTTNRTNNNSNNNDYKANIRRIESNLYVESIFHIQNAQQAKT